MFNSLKRFGRWRCETMRLLAQEEILGLKPRKPRPDNKQQLRQIVIVMRVREVFNNMSLKLGPATFTYFQPANRSFLQDRASPNTGI